MNPYRMPPIVEVSLWKKRTFLGYIKHLYLTLLVVIYGKWKTRFIRCPFCNKAIKLIYTLPPNVDIKNEVLKKHYHECTSFNKNLIAIRELKDKLNEIEKSINNQQKLINRIQGGKILMVRERTPQPPSTIYE